MMKNNRDGKFLNYKFMKHNRLVPFGWSETRRALFEEGPKRSQGQATAAPDHYRAELCFHHGSMVQALASDGGEGKVLNVAGAVSGLNTERA
jgi:hypothetical protein